MNIIHRLSLAAAITVTIAATPFQTASAEQSPLAQGHWVKISVTENGIHQITFDQLRQWGFENPSEVAVYGFGGTPFWNCFTPASFTDDLPQTYSIVDDSRILFYGESNVRDAFTYRSNTAPGLLPERNNAATAGYYLLTDSRPRETVEPHPFSYKVANYITSHDCIVLQEEETWNPGIFGQSLAGHNFYDDPDHTFTFTTPLYDRETSSTSNIYSTNAIWGAGKNLKVTDTYTKGTAPYSITYTLRNTDNVNGLIYDNTSTKSTAYRYSSVDPSVETYTYTVKGDDAGSFTWLCNDYIGIHYPRKNIIRGDEMTFHFRSIPAGQRVKFTEANPRTLVWDIVNSYSVRPYESTFDSSTGTLLVVNPTYYSYNSYLISARMIAFDPAARHREVKFEGTVENSDLHSMAAPELVIISTPLLLPQAQRLAALHREYLGQTVEVLTPEAIYNEFSSGTPSPNAIRRFLAHLKNREGSELKHVLMFGPASTDLRGNSGTARFLKEQDNLLPTYPTMSADRATSQIRGFSSDAYFGVLDNSITDESKFLGAPMDINVGRIPAMTGHDADVAVEKIRRYLTETPSTDAVNRALLFSEDLDAHSHFTDAENVSNEIDSETLTVTKVKAYAALYSATVTRSIIEQALRMGVGYLDFSGHGKTDSFTKQDIWNTGLIQKTEYGVFPLAMLATCHSYTFDELTSSVGQQMVFAPNGGSIATIGAGRTVYEAKNHALNQVVSRYYASSSPQYTYLGDIYREAVNLLNRLNPSDATLHNNNRCYNFCGDPALPKMGAADNSVTINRVDGKEFLPYFNADIEPLTPVEVTGSVTDADGGIDTSFNGQLYLTVYEAGRIAQTTDIPSSVTECIVDEDQLASVVFNVVQGQFSGTLTVPVPQRERLAADTLNINCNRITLLAVSEDGKTKRKNAYRNLRVGRNVPENIADTDAPVIESLYIDSPDFADGDAVADEFTVYAVVSPDASGLKITTGGVGGSSRLLIDGSRIIPVLGSMLSTLPDGSILITVPVNTITDGRHTATINVSDNCGNSASSTVGFTVVNVPATASLTVAEHPARIQATIGLSHSFAGEPTGRLVIEDHAGNTVFTRDNATFPFEWDLTDGETPVADGTYSAYAILNSAKQYGSTPKINITVVQKQ